MKPLLHPLEKVTLAYKSGRDMTLFTTKRLMWVDVKGITGKCIAYKSMLWEYVSLFSVETSPGNMWDNDSEFNIYTKLSHMPVVRQDLKPQCNVSHV